MSNNVKLEKDLYPAMCEWLSNHLHDTYRNSEIYVEDTSQVYLDTVLERYGVIDQYPQTVGIGIQIDVLGIVKRNGKANLFFIEAKKTALNTHNLGQILVYCKICNPEKAFLFSSGGMGSLSKLLNMREDLLDYSRKNENKLKIIQVAKWDVVKKSPDMTTMIPRL